MNRFFITAICTFGCLGMQAQDLRDKVLDNARALAKQGRYTQLIEDVLPVLNSSGLETADRAEILVLVAAGYQTLGRFADSHRMLDNSLALSRDNPIYMDRYADELTNLSVLYRDSGDADAMERAAAKALDLYDHVHDHAGLATIYVILGQHSADHGRLHQASRYVTKAEEQLKESAGDKTMNQIAVTDLRGELALHEHQPALAVASYEESLNMRIDLKGTANSETGWGYLLLGKADLKAGSTASALANLSRGLTIIDSTDGQTSLYYLYGQVTYAEALAANGQGALANRLRIEATKALTKLYRDQCARCEIDTAALR